MWIVILLFFFGKSAAQVPILGGCPHVETVQNFSIAQYAGKWYEAERYLAFFELGGKCVTANYSSLTNNSIKIVNAKISAITGESSIIVGVGTLKEPNSGKLSVVFPALPFQFEAPYWVLDTDYKNYAVVYSCSDFGVFSTRNAWILTRERNASVPIFQKAYAALDKNGISRAFLFRTNQKDCPPE